MNNLEAPTARTGLPLTSSQAVEHGKQDGDAKPAMKQTVMKLSVVGSGDAFGSGGRGNTCFRLDDARAGVIAVDFGASAIVAWNGQGFSTNDLDGVVISHLHGDHFGGLPFLLLECQFVAMRTRPLVIAGPPGLRARLEMLCEAMFPGMTANRWNFPWDVLEITPRESVRISGFEVLTREVRHPSGAPATCVQVRGTSKTFVYSGDTAWLDVLVEAADGADLFVVECYSGVRAIPNHIDWPALKANLPKLKARAIAVTHLGRSALALADEMRAEGLRVLCDGDVLEY